MSATSLRSAMDLMASQAAAQAAREEAERKKAEEKQLNDMLDAQARHAQEFRQGLPGMKRQIAEGLTQRAQSNISQVQRAVNQKDASRGLLYSGFNLGAKERARGQMMGNLASAINQANIGLDEAANTMDMNTLSTAYGLQQTKQAALNQAYSQALARMNADNSLAGDLLGIGLLAAI